MNLTKALTLMILLVGGLTTLSTAQASGHGGRHGPGHGVDRMIQQLNLTEQQAVAVREVFEQQRKVMEAAHAGGRRPSEEERQAHRTALDARLAEVLTEPQMERFREMRSNRPGGAGRGHGKGYGHGAGKMRKPKDDTSGEDDS
ncbi:MAG: Spy/CpxP family protein refolding chaperone [Xanthomonadales bacterium]|nr:Spy/CpxP family protein refolding chaperone [Xanthomonadales bacterium]